MSITDFFASVVRTLVPVAVGLIGGALIAAGIEIDETALELTITGVFVGGYYSLVRLLENRWPVLGVLLGWKAQPHYDGQES